MGEGVFGQKVGNELRKIRGMQGRAVVGMHEDASVHGVEIGGGGRGGADGVWRYDGGIEWSQSEGLDASGLKA